jgi:hypothetical protein
VNPQGAGEQNKVGRIRGYYGSAVASSRQGNESIVLKLSAFVAIPIFSIPNLLNQFACFPPV